MIEDRHAHQALRLHNAVSLELRGQLSFPFVATILKPDLYLGSGEIKR